jgi:uncharacterized phage protein (TIGR02220 family)
MAQKRMFDKSIIDSDAFLDMSLSSQALYFHLNMRADDEGFINNPKRIMRMIGCNDDDLTILILKKFILPFESGVIVIKHWRINNYLRADRFNPTSCFDERKNLEIQKNGIYSIKMNDGIPFDNQMPTTGCHRIEKNRIEENRIEKNRGEEISLKDTQLIEKVIDYLNKKTGCSYKKSSKKNQTLITARQNEGNDIADFIKVIDIKTEEWLKNDEMRKYLRPETLFGNKFEGYLNQGEMINAKNKQSDKAKINSKFDPI